MELKKVLEKRHSCRSFQTKKVGLRHVYSIIDAGMKAPMAGNICTLRMVIVDDDDLKQNITNAAPHNKFLGEASHLIVVCSDLKQIKRMYGNKGEEYATQQAGAIIENMLLTIENLGLASCWVGSYDENAVKRLLVVPKDVKVEAILPIGYELRKSPRKSKIALKNCLFYNKYGKKTL